VWEITLGCDTLCGQVSLPTLAALLSFGGICTHMQIKAILGENMPSYIKFLLVRLVGSGLSFGVATLLLYLFPQVLATFSTGRVEAYRQISLVPSVALLISCIVFLSWFQSCIEKRKDCYEKSGVCL
jgi:membrane protein DedA with SNARE-associated domain